MTSHPFIDVFRHYSTAGYQPDVLTGYDSTRHRIAVLIGDHIVGEIVPGKCGHYEMAYAYEYRGTTRGRDGVTPIGPAIDPEALKRRIVSVMFNGDENAFLRAILKRILRK